MLRCNGRISVFVKTLSRKGAIPCVYHPLFACLAYSAEAKTEPGLITVEVAILDVIRVKYLVVTNLLMPEKLVNSYTINKKY